MKKQLIAFLTVFLMLVTGLLSVTAAADQRVFDEAGLFSAEETAQLDEAIARNISASGFDWAVVTTDDAEGSSSRDYADWFFLDHGIGTGEALDGVLFLIDMDNREIYISTSGTAIDYITDPRRENIFDHCMDDMANGYYADAALTVLSMGLDYYYQGIPDGQFREEEGHSLSPWALIPFGIASAAIALLVRWGILRSSRISSPEYSYRFMDHSSVVFRDCRDDLIDQFVTSRIIPREHSSGGGSSDAGSSTHSTGGHTFGGGGRSF